MLKSNRILRNQQRLIEQIQQTNLLLETLPERIGQNGAKVVVERLEIGQAHLDKLLFQLDRIDVQELSGTLNLGNNFQLEDGKAQVERSKNTILQNMIRPKLTNLTANSERTNESFVSLETIPSTESKQVIATEQGYTIRYP